MRIIHRYITVRYLSFVAGSVLLFSFLYILGDLLGHLEDIFKNAVPLQVVVKYYVAMVPLVMVNTFSLASILAGLYVIGDMNYSNEIIAIRTSGKGLGFVLSPIVITALFVCSLTFFINERFASPSVVYTSSIKEEFIKRNAPSQTKVLIKNLTFYGRDDALYFITEYYPEKTKMKGVVILFQDENHHIREKWVAEEGVWREGKWWFKNLVVYRFKKKGKEVSLSGDRFFYPHKAVVLTETPRDILGKENMLESLNVRRLLEALRRLRRSDSRETLLRFKSQLYHRLIMPLSPLVLLLAGLPLVLPIQRKPPGFSAFGIGLLIFLLYYVVDTVALGLAKSGIVSPIIPIVAVPILFLCYAFIRLSRIP